MAPSYGPEWREIPFATARRMSCDNQGAVGVAKGQGRGGATFDGNWAAVTMLFKGAE